MTLKANFLSFFNVRSHISTPGLTQDPNSELFKFGDCSLRLFPNADYTGQHLQSERRTLNSKLNAKRNNASVHPIGVLLMCWWRGQCLDYYSRCSACPGEEGKSERSRERRRVKRRKRSRRGREVGGAWLPSTSSLAPLPLGLFHLFLLDTRTHIKRRTGRTCVHTLGEFACVHSTLGDLKKTQKRGIYECRCRASLFHARFLRAAHSRVDTHKTIMQVRMVSCSVTAFKPWRMIAQQRVRKESWESEFRLNRLEALLAVSSRTRTAVGMCSLASVFKKWMLFKEGARANEY